MKDTLTQSEAVVTGAKPTPDMQNLTPYPVYVAAASILFLFLTCFFSGRMWVSDVWFLFKLSI